MFEYRVTKYDPSVRKEGRRYAEWTSISDVGSTLEGNVLTQRAYEEVEAAYIEVAVAFLQEAEVDFVVVRDLDAREHDATGCREGDAFTPMDAVAIMRKVLREERWCRLEGARGFIHFGYDYYMYVGAISPCPEAQRLAATSGLFIEEMRSPYHPEAEQ